jgi:hypothetical protein
VRVSIRKGGLADAERITIVREYVEAETGKGADALDTRPPIGSPARCQHLGSVFAFTKAAVPPTSRMQHSERASP